MRPAVVGFAVGCAANLVDEHDLLRHLVGCNLCAHKLAQHGFIRFVSCKQRCNSGHALPVIGVVPIGYFKDDVKSRATFKTIDGVRYSFPGDWALVEADGTLTLLGRGSGCINTAGEKVYPEEVEVSVKRHPDVIDCLVVGVDDADFGQRVTAVASLRAGSETDEAALREFVRAKLASYKVPKQIVLVDEVRRAANGKPDYGWARKTVEAALA